MKKKNHKILIGLIVFIILGGVFMNEWSKLIEEHEEAMNITIDNIDFSTLNDGTYVGEYEGGMYKWRFNKTEVQVKDGKVININLISASEGSNKKDYLTIYDRIIKNQSLQVDTISGATLTSKAYLKAVEIALKKAE